MKLSFLKILSVLLLLMKYCTVSAQNNLLIYGKVLDAHTRSTIAYCTVTIKSTQLFVTTNDSGEFEFHLPLNTQNDSLIISYIGYQRFSCKVEDAVNNATHKFMLHDDPRMLKEIIVTPRLSAPAVIDSIQKSYKTNYHTQPFNMYGFFRTYYVDNNKDYDRLIELAVKAEDISFNAKKQRWRKSDLGIIQARSSLNTNRIADTTDHSNILSGIWEYFEKDYLVLIDQAKKYFLIDTVTYKASDKILRLIAMKDSQKIARTSTIQMNVNCRTWGIESFEIKYDYYKELPSQIAQTRVDSLKFQPKNEKTILNFSTFNDHYYLSSAFQEFSRILITPRYHVARRFVAEYATNRIIEKKDDDNKEQLLKINRNRNLFMQVYKLPYHPEFWKTYNKMLSNPEIEKVINKLNTKEDIDEQFSNPDKYHKNSHYSKE